MPQRDWCGWDRYERCALNCLLIGGDGFIGRHLVRRLAGTGRDVVVLGRKPSATAPLPARAKYVCGDYGDSDTLRLLLREANEVIDLAYATVPKSSFEDPIFDLNANLPLAVGMLRAASDLDHLRRIVFVSSGGTVYGHAASLPVPEHAPTNPVSPYGITKLAIEKYGLMFHHLAGLPVTIVRPSNAYGEGQQPYRGQGLIATAMASVLQRRPMTLFGSDRVVRDYIHVEDVAGGIAAALERGTVGAIYNIGAGVGHSTRSVMAIISDLARSEGLEPEFAEMPARPFDVLANVLDCGRLRSDTGWRSTVELAEGLQRTWEWARQSDLMTQP